MANDNKKKVPVVEDVLFHQKPDRRLLSYAPDVTGQRTNRDRRGRDSSTPGTSEGYIKLQQDDKNGQRYLVDYEVTVRFTLDGRKQSIKMKGEDISTTGILLTMPTSAEPVPLRDAQDIRLTFEITPGSMPEGYEMMVRKIPAACVREASRPDGTHLYGMQFQSTLVEFSNTHRKNYMLAVASFFLAVIVFVIVLMRAESVIYFQFNRWLYLYSIIAATFLLTRYLFGSFYRPMKIDPDYTPGVTIIVPCFNEEQWIQHTILGCINQDYPIDKLEVIVVDDCSNDHSVDKIREMIEKLKLSDGDQKMYRVEDRLHYFVQPVNKGKREAMAVGAHMAKHELLVFVDSDSFLDPYAVRNIVQPFKDKKMGGVSGRTDVANTYTNALTKMQAVRYYITFRIMKAAEGYFDAVTCLSGPLSCYRKDLVLKYCDAWLHQKFLGQRATFGDDRSMTNFILRHHRTTYQDTAVCMTIVPNSHKMFLRQQMRWKRSWLRESIIAARYMWKKEPFMSLSFYMGLLVPIAAPVIVLYNLIYIPIMHRVFPLTFLVGMMMMALLMSMAQLFLRRSTTWIFGVWFCLYYEAVLLWQMPVAWFTFWKSTWGTRMTPADLAELEKETKKQQEKEARKGKKVDDH